MRNALLAKCEIFEHLFTASRIEEMIEHFYAEDATLEGLDLPAQRGRSAIIKIFAEARSSYREISINLDPVHVHGDIAFGGITNVNVLIDNRTEIHRGQMIWRKIDGEWFVQSDFFFPQCETYLVLA